MAVENFLFNFFPSRSSPRGECVRPWPAVRIWTRMLSLLDEKIVR